MVGFLHHSKVHAENLHWLCTLHRSKAGNTALLVCVDAFSKFVWMVSVRESTTRTKIKALQENIFGSFSVLEVLVSDNAQCFTSREFRQFCFGLGIKHVTTSLYYPQPSHAERFNKNLRAALIAHHSRAHTTWDQNLTWLQLTFNMAEHEATRSAPFRWFSPLGPTHLCLTVGKSTNYCRRSVTRGYWNRGGLWLNKTC